MAVDLIPDLWPELHLRRVVKETGRLLANIRNALKYKEKGGFNKLFTADIRLKLEYASHVCSPHLKEPRKSSRGRQQRWYHTESS